MAIEIVTRADARAKGLIRYFTGKACKAGHTAERQTSNGVCLECSKAIGERFARAHPDKIREKNLKYGRDYSPERREQMNAANRRYSSANREKVAEKTRRWESANPERKAANGKKWADANPEKIAAKNRRYKCENADALRPAAVARAKAWNKAHPEVVLMVARRRRIRKRKSQPGNYTAAMTMELLAKQKHKCAACFCKLTKQNRELDHIVAIARDGPDVFENLQWLCKPCNRSKSAKDHILWAQANGRLL